MRNLKILGLAAVAAMALMAVTASSASATGGMLYNGTTTWGAGLPIDFSIPANNEAVLKDTNGNELDKCTGSTVNGEVTNAGSSTVNPTGTISALTWTNCTFTTTTISTGNKLSIEWTSATEGKVYGDSTIEVTIVTLGSCVYGVEAGTQVGTLTTNSTGAATFHATALVHRFNMNAVCPTTAIWTGSYTGTSPSNLRIEAS